MSVVATAAGAASSAAVPGGASSSDEAANGGAGVQAENVMLLAGPVPRRRTPTNARRPVDLVRFLAVDLVAAPPVAGVAVSSRCAQHLPLITAQPAA